MKPETAEIFYRACVGEDPTAERSPLDWLNIYLNEPRRHLINTLIQSREQSRALLDALREAVEQTIIDTAPASTPEEDGRR